MNTPRDLSRGVFTPLESDSLAGELQFAFPDRTLNYLDRPGFFVILRLRSNSLIILLLRYLGWGLHCFSLA